MIYYSYFDNTFSYEVSFEKDGEILKDGIVKNIVISYNKVWELKKDPNFSRHEQKDFENNKIIAIECNKSTMCASTLSHLSNNIDLNNIKFSLSNLINNNYLSGYNKGFIKKFNGVPIGNFNKFRFNAITGDIVDGSSIDINKWHEEQTGSGINSLDRAEKEEKIFINPPTNNEIESTISSTSTLDILIKNFNNDSDNDGLTNLQESAYHTNSLSSDTDHDGHSDLEEINNGYNPLGAGKLISDECLKNLENDDCYWEEAKAKKDASICQKFLDRDNFIKCLFSINLITKNIKICEDLNKVKENNIADFYNACLKQLSDIANPTTRTFERDAKTISDVKQIMTALEIYYNDYQKYPSEVAEGGAIGTFLSSVPRGLKGETDNCLTNYEYKYLFINDQEYSLSYCIDGITNTAKDLGINDGINMVTNNGFKTSNKDATEYVESYPEI